MKDWNSCLARYVCIKNGLPKRERGEKREEKDADKTNRQERMLVLWMCFSFLATAARNRLPIHPFRDAST